MWWHKLTARGVRWRLNFQQTCNNECLNASPIRKLASYVYFWSITGPLMLEAMKRRDDVRDNLLTGVTPNYCGKWSDCQVYLRGYRGDDEERWRQRQSSYWSHTRVLWLSDQSARCTPGDVEMMSGTIFLLVSHQSTGKWSECQVYARGCRDDDEERWWCQRHLLTGVTPDYCGKWSNCQVYPWRCRGDDEKRWCQRLSSHWCHTWLLW